MKSFAKENSVVKNEETSARIAFNIGPDNFGDGKIGKVVDNSKGEASIFTSVKSLKKLYKPILPKKPKCKCKKCKHIPLYNKMLSPGFILKLTREIIRQQNMKTKVLIDNTKKDKAIKGNETIIYKDGDGTLSTITIKDLLKNIIVNVNKGKTSYDIKQDNVSKLINQTVNNINNSVTNIENELETLQVWKYFTEDEKI